MSVGAKHWALSQSVPGGSAPRVILFFLADWIIGEDQTECWPSVERLVFETGMNRKTIIKAIATLEENGLISRRVIWIYDEQKNVPKKRNIYRLYGFVPSDWVNSRRPWPGPEDDLPKVPNLERPENGTTQKRNVPNSERPKLGARRSQIRSTDVPNLGHKQGEVQGKEQGMSIRSPSDDLVLSADSEKSKPKAKRRKPSTPCPWESGARIPEDLDEWAAAEYPTINAGEEFKKFVGWALSKDMRYARWDQAFRNWMGNALKYQSQRGGYGSSGYRSKRQPTCPGDWEKEYKGVDYTRGAVMKEFTPEESARLATLAEEMNF